MPLPMQTNLHWLRRWIDTEPLPFFKELREKRPILVTPKFTLITRFDDSGKC